MKFLNLQDFLALLKGVKKLSNGEYLALCPNHDDHNQSLSVRQNDNKILPFCHAGCATPDVVKAMGLTMADLFLNHTPKAERKIVATYNYPDELSNLLYQVLRYDPKDFSVRRPDGKGGFISGLGNTRKVIYNLPGVLEAIKNDQTIYIVEGERDANRLIKQGLVATTSPFGAGKWLDWDSC